MGRLTIDPALRELLDRVNEGKRGVYDSNKPVVNPNIQEEADVNDMFELTKSGTMYFVTAIFGDGRIRVADGGFIFVILAEDPNTVIVGAQFDAPGFKRVNGHTSLTYRHDVVYAGEILFKWGRLLKWTNGSGHYLPSCDSRYKSLTPYVKTLLPEDKFVTVFDEHKGEFFVYDPDMLTARGYAN